VLPVYWIGQDRVTSHVVTGHRLEVSGAIQPEEGDAIDVREPKDHTFFVQTREQVSITKQQGQPNIFF
jgi:hypothetical protein